jgi:hypothetical protein
LDGNSMLNGNKASLSDRFSSAKRGISVKREGAGAAGGV